jgi:hypothetical protein
MLLNSLKIGVGKDCIIYCTSQFTCSDHGTCRDNGTCRCDPNWKGDNCSEQIKVTPSFESDYTVDVTDGKESYSVWFKSCQKNFTHNWVRVDRGYLRRISSLTKSVDRTVLSMFNMSQVSEITENSINLLGNTCL